MLRAFSVDPAILQNVPGPLLPSRGFDSGYLLLMLLRCLLIIALCLPLIPAHADADLRVTFLHGQMKLLRGTQVLLAEPGVPLAESDMLETGPKTYAMVEFADGTRLALGDETRLMLRRMAGGKAGAREFAMLSGWIKIQAPATAAEDFRLLGARLSIQGRNASVIVRDDAMLFVEHGTVAVSIANAKGRLGAPQRLNSGRFGLLDEGRSLALSERPAAAFVAAMPRPFRDALPMLLERFKAREVEPKVVGEVAYEDVAHWLQGPQPWRSGFVTRFRPRLGDKVFRRQLADNVARHTEWDRVLFPEKYRPRNASSRP